MGMRAVYNWEISVFITNRIMELRKILTDEEFVQRLEELMYIKENLIKNGHEEKEIPPSIQDVRAGI